MFAIAQLFLFWTPFRAAGWELVCSYSCTDRTVGPSISLPHSYTTCNDRPRHLATALAELYLLTLAGTQTS